MTDLFVIPQNIWSVNIGMDCSSKQAVDSHYPNCRYARRASCGCIGQGTSCPYPDGHGGCSDKFLPSATTWWKAPSTARSPYGPGAFHLGKDGFPDGSGYPDDRHYPLPPVESPAVPVCELVRAYPYGRGSAPSSSHQRISGAFHLELIGLPAVMEKLNQSQLYKWKMANILF